MSFRFSASGSLPAGGTAVTADFGAPNEVAVGDLVVALGFSASNSAQPQTFSNGGTATLSSWTTVGALTQLNAGDFYYQQIAYARVTGAGTLTVTATATIWERWIIAGVFDEMPDPLVLQTQGYARTTSSNPTTGNMTPSSAPAWQIGFCVNWSTTTAPGVASGWSDGGAHGAPDNFMRLAYRRLTDTTAVPANFSSSAITAHTSGLIFTEASGGPAAPTITDAGDETFTDGETGIVITGTNLPTTAGSVIISPTDNAADGNAVTQTITNRSGGTSVTFTAARGALAAGSNLYLFVTNDDSQTNASGYVVQFAPRQVFPPTRLRSQSSAVSGSGAVT